MDFCGWCGTRFPRTDGSHFCDNCRYKMRDTLKVMVKCVKCRFPMPQPPCLQLSPICCSFCYDGPIYKPPPEPPARCDCGRLRSECPSFIEYGLSCGLVRYIDQHTKNEYRLAERIADRFDIKKPT